MFDVCMRFLILRLGRLFNSVLFMFGFFQWQEIYLDDFLNFFVELGFYDYDFFFL